MRNRFKSGALAWLALGRFAVAKARVTSNRRTKVRQIKFLWSVLGFNKTINLGRIRFGKKGFSKKGRVQQIIHPLIYLSLRGSNIGCTSPLHCSLVPQMIWGRKIMAILYFWSIFHPRFYWQNDFVQIYHYLLIFPKICLVKRKIWRSENCSWNFLRELSLWKL